MTPDDRVTGHLRGLAPQVLGAVVRRYGHFELAEDAVQEALVAGASQWPVEGIPDDPRAWLITVASRRLTDLLRAETARTRREANEAAWSLSDADLARSADEEFAHRQRVDSDDSLVLLYLCCHPDLSPASQLALTLRAVGGLTTAEVARAFLVPEATMTRRISRAKQTLKRSSTPFRLPSADERPARTLVVLRALYLLFTEGYASTAGSALHRPDLAAEAIRLTRGMHGAIPQEPEVAGLLALMLLTDARRLARTGAEGEPIPMAGQDRSRWDAAAIAEGIALITDTLPRGPVGPYQLQAAIAALHDEAPSAEQTDWPQIVALYGALLRIDPTPVVALNHAVAVAMASGPDAGLALLGPLADESTLTDDHRLWSARAHLFELRGERERARAEYLGAAERTLNLPQQRYLRRRAAELGDRDHGITD